MTAEQLAVALLALAAGDDGRRAPEPQAPAADFDQRSERGGSRPDRQRPAGRHAAGPVYRVAVGRQHGVRPAGIVGAITAEGGIRGKDLGRIEIYDTYSLVEIGGDLSNDAVSRIGRAVVSGQPLRIRPYVTDDRTEHTDRSDFRDRSRPRADRGYGDRPSRPSRPTGRDDFRSGSRESAGSRPPARRFAR